MGGRERVEPTLTMDIVQCEHCGRCLEVCPTYQALRTETMSARGRWDLIAGVVSGELQPGPRYFESLSLCLNCMACSAMCPKGVDVERMVREAKAGFSRRPVEVYLNRAVFTAVLLNRPLLRMLLRLLSGARALLPHASPDTGARPTTSPSPSEGARPTPARQAQNPLLCQRGEGGDFVPSLPFDHAKHGSGLRGDRYGRRPESRKASWTPDSVGVAVTSIETQLGGAAPTSALSRHLPLFLSDLLHGFAIPKISGKSLFRLSPERIAAATDVPARGEVSYFVGCFNALVDTTPAEAVIRVLAHNGYQVHIPRGQTCCAAPMLFSGDKAMTRRVMRKNLRVLQGEGPVLVSCATCGSMLRKEYPALAAEAVKGSANRRISNGQPQNEEGRGTSEGETNKLAEAAAKLARRTVDFVELLAQAGNLREGHIPVRRRVTIHDPCDLVRGQGISSEIRQLLKAVPGIEIVEMDHPDRCCGGGGTYSISHPETAREIGRIKAHEILDTGASVVVTACPGCILQLQRVLAAEGRPLPVLHPAEVLAHSYGFGSDPLEKANVESPISNIP